MGEQLLFHRFRVLKKCGSGGTGEVYKAEDTRLKRIVALKRVRAEKAPEKLAKAVRLLKEAENMGRIDHPNVVTIHDVIEAETSVTLVMEFVDGVPFRDLYQKRPLAEHELLGFFRQMLLGLEAVHEAGIIHRDVNPKNVLVTGGGLVKLVDFSLAGPAEAAEHRSGGTIGYMAPESLKKGARIGFGVDVYGLGFIVYQAMIGGPQFQKLYGTADAVEWARWLLSRERFRTLVELGKPVSAGLSAIVEQMLEKDVKDRYAKASEARADLDRLLAAASRENGEPQRAEGPSLAAGVMRLLPGLRGKTQGGEA